MSLAANSEGIQSSDGQTLKSVIGGESCMNLGTLESDSVLTIEIKTKIEKN